MAKMNGKIRVTVDKKNKTLTIVVPLESPRLSGSGKTMVIASTHGNQVTDTEYDGHPITVGVNAYFKE